MQLTLNSKSSVLGGAYWDVYGKGRAMLIVLLTVSWLFENMSNESSYAKVKRKNGPCSTLSIPVSDSEQETMIFLECHLRSKADFSEMRKNFEKKK